MRPARAPSLVLLLSLPALQQGEVDILRGLFEKYAVPAVDWVLEGIDGEELVRRPKQAVPVTNLNMITQLCTLLAATITDHPRMSDPQVGRARGEGRAGEGENAGTAGRGGWCAQPQRPLTILPGLGAVVQCGSMAVWPPASPPTSAPFLPPAPMSAPFLCPLHQSHPPALP